MSKVLKLTIAAVAAAVVVLVGGVAVWYFVLDSADPVADIGAIQRDATTVPGGTSSGSTKTSADGNWKIEKSATVFVGYRVDEVLRTISKTANGRSTAVDGTMTVAGAQITEATVTADVRQLKSDAGQRDNAIKGRGLETDKFPQATFTLTSPIALPSAPAIGQAVQATAKGNLTLHGVTKAVDFPLTAQWDGDTIKVASQGSGLLIKFADYNMEKISVPGVVETKDEGTIELQLLYVPAS